MFSTELKNDKIDKNTLNANILKIHYKRE